MNRKIMTIATIMIIFSIALLCGIYFAYISQEPKEINRIHSGESLPIKSVTIAPSNKPASTKTGTEIKQSGEEPKKPTEAPEPTIAPTKKATNTPKPTQVVVEVPTIMEQSGNQEIESGNTPVQNNENIIVEPIIKSDNETSNQEKQQVLTEIDDALQGLLEAVGKVPTVDEDKLNQSLENGEV